jgi:hypothetical protein
MLEGETWSMAMIRTMIRTVRKRVSYWSHKASMPVVVVLVVVVQTYALRADDFDVAERLVSAVEADLDLLLDLLLRFQRLLPQRKSER